MKKINLDVTLPKSITKEEEVEIKKVGILSIFGNILNQGVESLYPNGLPMVKGRLLARVQNKIDVLPIDSVEIEFEDAEHDFVKSVFTDEKVKYHPKQYQLVAQFYDKVIVE